MQAWWEMSMACFQCIACPTMEMRFRLDGTEWPYTPVSATSPLSDCAMFTVFCLSLWLHECSLCLKSLVCCIWKLCSHLLIRVLLCWTELRSFCFWRCLYFLPRYQNGIYKQWTINIDFVANCKWGGDRGKPTVTSLFKILQRK